MGLIEDGTIKGHLPSNEVFAVHYPAYPSSTPRAVETLGGVDSIAKVRSSKINKLELRFRPEDPFCHPAFGQLHPSSSLLLRISKNNSSDDQNDNHHGSLFNVTCSKHSIAQTEKESSASTSTVSSEKSASSTVLSADIVARVREAYRFSGMVDYQHVLAVHAENACKKQRKWDEEREPFEKGDILDKNDENLMILVPPLFSMKDVPENIVLRPSVTSSSKKKQEGVVQHRWEMEIEPSLAIDFNIKEIPKKVNWEEHIPQGIDQWQWQKTVSGFFDERPIWPKSSISERLNSMGLRFGDHMLKRLLFRCAYYFGSGPFHRFWVKKGYDPRKDPESRMYQIMDFRVPPPLRGYCDASGRKKHKWKDICTFRVFPYKCQTYLQLFELADDYIQEEIRRPPGLTVCTCSTGWFTSHVLNSIRLRIFQRFLSVYPQGGIESLVKSVSERFEKSKKMRFQVNYPRPGDDGESHDNQELTADEDKVEEEEDNEENDSEDEEAEEEMDVDDPIYLGGDDADFSLEPDSYLGGENISRNYLQELFESFPSTQGGGDKLHGADSDGEYQIYEQDNDDNYSDDDYY